MANTVIPGPHLRRALYRASHRGTKEMDWLLGRFAETHGAGMSAERFALFERLLVLPDLDIEAWIKHGGAPESFAALIAEIRRFHRLEE